MQPTGSAWCWAFVAALVLVPAGCAASPKQCRCGRSGGELSRLQIQRVVRSSYGRIRACYRKGLRTNRNLGGTVVVRFVIGENGCVQEARDGGSDLPDASVVDCVVGVYRDLRFSGSVAEPLRVVYPLRFLSTPCGGAGVAEVGVPEIGVGRAVR